MKKLLLLSVLLLFVFITNAQSKTVAVVREMTDINKLNEITVTLTVKSSLLENINIESLGRIEELVPDKCECTVIETAGAESSFKLKPLSFYWLKLPKEDFQIKYKIKVLEQTENKCIDGKFNYVKTDKTRKKIAVEGKKCFE